MFDERMAQAVPVEKLQAVWESLPAQAGAAKGRGESAYHLRYSGGWLERLGDGTPESHGRAARSLAKLWPFVNELFADDEVDRAAAEFERWLAGYREGAEVLHGYGTGEWTDSAVRRYVTDAGPLLDRLHALVRSDCTTRNRRRAAALQRSYDSLERRIAQLEAVLRDRSHSLTNDESIQLRPRGNV